MIKLVPPTDPVLWARANPVVDIAAQVSPHVKDVKEFLIRTNGLGIAAPQFGVGLRFFGWRNVAVSLVINPEITAHGNETEVKIEGCFSFPGQLTARRRYKQITVSYQDETGRQIVKELSGRNARVFQHEIDHLNGINLFPQPKAV